MGKAFRSRSLAVWPCDSRHIGSRVVPLKGGYAPVIGSVRRDRWRRFLLVAQGLGVKLSWDGVGG